MSTDPNRIRELRRERDWSQQKLADLVGVSKVTISDLELGKMQLTLDYMKRVAKALGVTAGELLNIEDNPLLPAGSERELIERYREASSEERKNIDRVTEALISRRPPRPSDRERAA